MLMHKFLFVFFLQPIGLVDYKSLKKVHLPYTSFLESILETVYGLSVNMLL